MRRKEYASSPESNQFTCTSYLGADTNPRFLFLTLLIGVSLLEICLVGKSDSAIGAFLRDELPGRELLERAALLLQRGVVAYSWIFD